MGDEHKKSVWPWIAVMLIGLPMLYVASFGSACWWFADRVTDVDYDLDYDGGFTAFQPRAPHAYWPFGWLILNGPQPVGRILCWYATAFAKYPVALPCDRQNTFFIIPDEY
jgi:hypothetical protein